MNTSFKTNLALASLISLSCLSVSAQADVSVYGKANVSLNKHDSETGTVTNQDNWQLESNASRLGVKGSADLENNLKAIYQMEFEVSADDGKADSKDIEADCDDDDATSGENCASVSTSFKQRNIFVGIQGGFGTVIAGKHDTPLKSSQGKLDRFNDLPLGDIKNVISGEVRASNIVMYTSPKHNGLEGKLAFIPGEEDGTGSDDDNGIADAFSTSVSYTQDQYWIALAADSEVEDTDTIRVSGEYTIDETKVALLVQNAEPSETTTNQSNSSVVLNAQYQIDAWTLKAQYSSDTESEDAQVDIDTTLITIGSDYKLSKKAKLYTYLSSWDMEQGTASTEQTTFGLGTEVKF